MGTDIHMYSERKVNGQWVMNDRPFESPFDKSIVYEYIYDSRNYNFYTILCGVRDNIKCSTIVDPERGLPKDLSQYAKNFFHTSYLHDVGYATLTELLEYNWDNKASETRLCTLEVYNKYLSTGNIDSYCKGVSYKTIDEDEAKEILKNGIENYRGEHVYVRAIIEKSLSEYAGEFYSHVIPKLCQLSISECDGESDDVRIVFGFDS